MFAFQSQMKKKKQQEKQKTNSADKAFGGATASDWPGRLPEFMGCFMLLEPAGD